MGFRRDTCKWLQSLDLKIKNPKWDFANGYLVATIFSRYFPNELQVDKFYCGMGTAQKANNWEQLGKFFKKHGISIPKDAMYAVMHCHDNAAVLFIENVFALLTNTKIPSTIDNVPSDSTEPHFALPTTSSILRKVDATPVQAELILSEHREFLKHSRNPRSRTNGDMVGGANKLQALEPPRINKIEVRQNA